jgi:hypothetical protein
MSTVSSSLLFMIEHDALILYPIITQRQSRIMLLSLQWSIALIGGVKYPH